MQHTGQPFKTFPSWIDWKKFGFSSCAVCVISPVWLSEIPWTVSHEARILAVVVQSPSLWDSSRTHGLQHARPLWPHHLPKFTFISSVMPSSHLILWLLEWVVISYSRGSSQPRDRTSVLHLLHWQADSLPLSLLRSQYLLCSLSAMRGQHWKHLCPWLGFLFTVGPCSSLWVWLNPMFLCGTVQYRQWWYIVS